MKKSAGRNNKYKQRLSTNLVKLNNQRARGGLVANEAAVEKSLHAAVRRCPVSRG